MAHGQITTAEQVTTRSSVLGLLIGFGLGGFVDGILLDQILQWHHMLSSTRAYPPTTLGGLQLTTACSTSAPG
ncbi:DUF2243 domain-containing protein [Carbonactinospora thermoautotrophica]|uniref:DUF2243 domain-containing protein n=1 Tax=Carbonactinospora thermoautotrophica TaxID=1469144 RepID=UPI00226F5F09|nr:DUF2243 domain-containing protein [Carbonactinospora thermoautotrophica]